MPRVSVLIGTYNCAATLPAALDSLYAGTYTDFRLILCDDGSTDGTFAVAKSFAEAHQGITLLRNEQNCGLNHTLNRCLAEVDTEYVARMDGDDISHPERLRREVDFLDAHPEYAFVSTPMTFFDERGVFKVQTSSGPVEPRHFLRGNPICHPAVMMRRTAVEAVGGYREGRHLLRVEDQDLWFRLYAAGFRAYNLEESLYLFREDRNAVRRRTFRSRINEARIRSWGFRQIGLPLWAQLFALKPLLLALLPTPVYRFCRGK